MTTYQRQAKYIKYVIGDALLKCMASYVYCEKYTVG